MNTSQFGSENEYAKRVYAEQVRSVYHTFTIAIAGTFIGALLLIAIKWDVVEHSSIYLWLSVFSIFHSLRAIFVYRFNRLQPDDEACIIWGRGFVISSAFAGLIWSMGIVITAVDDNLADLLTVAIITVGLSAGAVSSISVLRSAFLAFVFPIMLTLVILFLLEKTYTTNIISVIIFLTLLFIIRGADNIYRSNKVNFRLLLEAADRELLLVTAKEIAEIATKTQSEFLDNMSHELRTPLHGILGFAQVGIEKSNDTSNKDMLKYFTKISESGERLKILLDDLLDLRKIEEGKIELNIRYEELPRIIIDCVEEQEAVINAHKLHLKYNFDTSLPKILCDKVRIGQVVMNILSNAIKFSPQRGLVTITGELAEIDNIDEQKVNVVRISISDQGTGIPQDERESIFNKFIQLKKNVSSSGGTGLGLAISREIINEHKGQIWCENNAEGGAIFYFDLPI